MTGRYSTVDCPECGASVGGFEPETVDDGRDDGPLETTIVVITAECGECGAQVALG